MKKITSFLALLLTLSISTLALAHKDHDHDDKPTPMIKLDMLNKKEGIVLFVTNRGTKVSTQGATGKLLLISGTNKAEIALQPAGENQMESTTPTKLDSGTKARATITFADKTTISYDLLVK